MTTETETDFYISGRGHDTVLLLCPVTDAARQWCTDYLPDDCPMLGPNYAIENRYLANIIDGIETDGLTVHP